MKKNRVLYLLRHGEVEFQNGIKRCIGRTDIPMSPKGWMQAAGLKEYFKNIEVEAICSSPLKRSRDMAEVIADNCMAVMIKDGLAELYMGEWENIPLDRIEKGLESEPIYGEKREEGLNRFSKTIQELLDHSAGNLICVAHAGVNCCFLASLLGTPLETSRALRQPYGCVNRIEVDEKGELHVLEYGGVHYEANENGRSSRTSVMSRYYTDH